MIEDLQADTAAWQRLPTNTRSEKEAFLASQQHAATGFTAMAVTTLRLMNVLTLNRTMVAQFTAPGVVRPRLGTPRTLFKPRVNELLGPY